MPHVRRQPWSSCEVYDGLWQHGFLCPLVVVSPSQRQSYARAYQYEMPCSRRGPPVPGHTGFLEMRAVQSTSRASYAEAGVPSPLLGLLFVTEGDDGLTRHGLQAQRSLSDAWSAYGVTNNMTRTAWKRWTYKGPSAVCASRITPAMASLCVHAVGGEPHLLWQSPPGCGVAPDPCPWIEGKDHAASTRHRSPAVVVRPLASSKCLCTAQVCSMFLPGASFQESTTGALGLAMAALCCGGPPQTRS